MLVQQEVFFESEGNVAFVTDMEKVAGKLDIAFVVDRENATLCCCQRWGGRIGYSGSSVISDALIYVNQR